MKSSVFLSFFAVFLQQARATVTGPVISSNFPDPAVLRVGSTLYAYSTNSDRGNIPVATSSDGGSSWVIQGDSLPNLGSWATTGATWAPHVVDRGDGTYILYYAANSPSEGTHCVGAATSGSPTGPFSPSSSPIACQTSGGGAIDISGFQDSDGTRYVIYKVDGNNLGGGGSCGNGDGSHSTPLMLQRMNGDGVTTDGSSPIAVLDRGQYDGPLIEAPFLIKKNGVYFLFFSSNCYNTELYDISYATSSSVTGPYTKATTPFKVTGDNGLTAPGGLSALSDGSLAVFHDTSDPDPLTRPMFTATLNFNGNTVSA